MKNSRVERVKRVLLSNEPILQKLLFLVCCGIFVYGAIRARLGHQPHNAWPYYMMRFFRWLGLRNEFLIDVQNPLVPGKTLRLSLDLRRNMHVRYFFARSTIDETAIRMAGESMTNSECFLDVGSNSGLFALSIAQTYPMKSVIAVEPVPDNAKTILQNIELNALTNIRVVQSAATLQSGNLTFYVHPFHDGGGGVDRPSSYQTMGLNFPVPEAPEAITVSTVTLDLLVDRFDSVVIKIDVEGHEHEVLHSGEKSFAKGIVKFVILEVSAHNGPWVLKFCEKFKLIPTYFDGSSVGSLKIDDVSADIILRPVLVGQVSSAASATR